MHRATMRSPDHLIRCSVLGGDGWVDGWLLTVEGGLWLDWMWLFSADMSIC